MNDETRKDLEAKLLDIATRRVTKADQEAAIMARIGLLVIDRLDAINGRLTDIEDTLHKEGGR